MYIYICCNVAIWMRMKMMIDHPRKKCLTQKSTMMWSMRTPFLIHTIHTQILTTCGWAVQQRQVDLEFHRYVRPTEKPQLTDPKVATSSRKLKGSTMGRLERSESLTMLIIQLTWYLWIQFLGIMVWRPENIEWKQEFCIELTGDSAVVGRQCDLTARGFGDTPTKPCLSPFGRLLTKCGVSDSHGTSFGNSSKGGRLKGVRATLFFHLDPRFTGHQCMTHKWIPMPNDHSDPPRQTQLMWFCKNSTPSWRSNRYSIALRLDTCLRIMDDGRFGVGKRVVLYSTSEFCIVSKNLFQLHTWIRDHWWEATCPIAWNILKPSVVEQVWNVLHGLLLDVLWIVDCWPFTNCDTVGFGSPKTSSRNSTTSKPPQTWQRDTMWHPIIEHVHINFAA